MDGRRWWQQNYGWSWVVMGGHGWLHNLVMPKFLNEFGKIFFPVGKVEFWTYCKFCVHKRDFSLRTGPEYLRLTIYLDVYLPKLSRHMKWKYLRHTLKPDSFSDNWKPSKNDEKHFLFHLNKQLQYTYCPISNNNQAKKFGYLIKYNMRNISVERSYTKCAGETILRPFKKSKLSISLDQ